MENRYGSAITATLSGALDRLRPITPIGQLGPEDRLDGACCLVTGANTGIGRAVATELARRGGRVVMAGRTLDERARAAIAAASGNGEMEHLDLARLRSVSAFCARQREQGRRFQVVVLNAGVVPREARRTEDGLEESFQVNYLSNLLLVETLLADRRLDGNGFAMRPRIVFLSSEAHRSARAIDAESLGAFRPYGLTGSVAEYGRVKLLLTSYAVELARHLAPGGQVSVAVHALCPGAVRTRIGREAPWWSQPLLQIAMRLFFRSPERGAEPAVYLCCARALEGRTAVYLHGMAEKSVSALAADEESGRRLREVSLRLLEERGFPLAPTPVLQG